jgi:hypothetical protein
MKYEIGDRVVTCDGLPGIVEEIINTDDCRESYCVSVGNGVDFGTYCEEDLKPYRSVIKNEEDE